MAISIETAIQNGALAFVILALAFPSPHSEMGRLVIIAFYLCSTGPIVFFVYGGYELVRCCRGKNAVEDEENPTGNFAARNGTVCLTLSRDMAKG